MVDKWVKATTSQHLHTTLPAQYYHTEATMSVSGNSAPLQEDYEYLGAHCQELDFHSQVVYDKLDTTKRREAQLQQKQAKTCFSN